MDAFSIAALGSPGAWLGLPTIAPPARAGALRSAAAAGAPPMAMDPLMTLMRQQEQFTLLMLRLLLELMRNRSAGAAAASERPSGGRPRGAPGSAGERSGGSAAPASASEAKKFLLTLPRGGDDPASEFTGLQDSFARPLAGFFRELQGMGVRVTLTAGYEKSGHSPNSLHYVGRAVDFVVPNYNRALAGRISSAARRYGLTVLDEYSKPSAYSTGGHFDVRLA